MAWSGLWQITLFRKGECLCSTFKIRKSASFPHPQFITLFIFHFPVSNVACDFPDWVQLKRFPLTNFVKAQLGQTFNMSFLWKSKYQSYYNYEVQHCTFDSWIVLIVQFPQGERLKIWLIPLQIIRKKLFLFKNIF